MPGHIIPPPIMIWVNFVDWAVSIYIPSLQRNLGILVDPTPWRKQIILLYDNYTRAYG